MGLFYLHPSIAAEHYTAAETSGLSLRRICEPFRVLIPLPMPVTPGPGEKKNAVKTPVQRLRRWTGVVAAFLGVTPVVFTLTQSSCQRHGRPNVTRAIQDSEGGICHGHRADSAFHVTIGRLD